MSHDEHRAGPSRRRFLRTAAVIPLGAVTLATTATARGAATTTAIDSCTTITDPGTYRLAADIDHRDGGICIRIRASDVVLDGNGHEISGPGGDEITVGVSTDDSSENVVVRNLTVTATTYGVNVVGSRNRFFGVRSNENRITGFLVFGDETAIVNATAAANEGSGVSLVEANRCSVTRSALRSNGAAGVVLRQGGDDNAFRRNTIVGNGRADVPALSGITAWEGGDGNVFAHNVVRSNAGYGIALNEFNPDPPATNAVIHRNVADGNARSGILLRATAAARVTGNVARTNRGDGITVEDVDGTALLGNTADRNQGDGVHLAGSDGNVLVRNSAARNRGDGIELADADNNVIVNNRVCDNGEDPVAVDADSTGNVLRNNATRC